MSKSFSFLWNSIPLIIPVFDIPLIYLLRLKGGEFMKKNLLKITMVFGLIFSVSSPVFGSDVKPMISDCGGSEHPVPCWAY